ncbi:MAG: hypothetical protein E2O89_00560 [Alphaproteobacteria bacterium]|nr:MAG: hypothetical protein E2O89_00560 [Alphaproteobacteria bacterium]
MRLGWPDQWPKYFKSVSPRSRRLFARLKSILALIAMSPAVKHGLEVAAGITGVLTVLAALAIWQLSQGPVSLGLIAPNIVDALNRSIAGYRVEFDETTMDWSEGFNSFDVTVLQVRIFNPERALVARIPEISLRFGIAALWQGTPMPKTVEMVGASAIVTRHADGTFSVDLQPTGSGDIQGQDPLLQVPSVRPMNQFLSAIFSVAAEQPFGGELEEFIIREGSIVFVDRRSLSAWHATGAHLRFSRTDSGADGVLDAKLQLGGSEVDLHVAGAFDRDTGFATVAMEFGDFMPSQLSAAANRFSALNRVQVPIRGSASFIVNADGVLEGADIILSASDGIVDLSGIDLTSKKANAPTDQPWADELARLKPLKPPPPLGRVFIEGALLEISLDTTAQRFVIEQFSLWGPKNRIDFSGGLSMQMSEDDPTEIAWASLDLSSQSASFFVQGILEDQLVLDDFAFAATYNNATQSLKIENLSFSAYGGSGNFSGDVLYGHDLEGDFSPGIRLQGRLRNMDIRSMLQFWPVFLVRGARDWIDNNVFHGTITRGEFNMDLPVGVLGNGPLPNNALRFDFAFEGGDASYIKGLTRAADMAGSATLYGNSFSLDMPTARIGDIAVADVHIEIPHLAPKGATAVYSAVLKGKIERILELIDMPPLKLTRKFGLDPKSVGGDAEIQLKILRPMRRYVPIEYIDYEITALASGVGLPRIAGNFPLSNGDITLKVDPIGITAEGQFDLAGLPIELNWREIFSMGEGASTTYEIKLAVNASNLLELGIDVGEFLQGPVSAIIKTKGKGIVIYSATVDVDFTDAAIALDTVNWSKESGSPGSAKFDLNFDPEGASSIKDVTVIGEDLEIRGDLYLAADYRLVSGDFSVIKLGSELDFAIEASRRSDGDGLEVRVTGQTFNAGALVREFISAEGGGSGTPISVDVNLQSVKLNEGVKLQDVVLQFATDGERMSRLTLDASFPEGGGVYANLTGPMDGRRYLEISSTDSGQILRGITGNTSIIGGSFVLTAHLDPPRTGSNSQDAREQEPETVDDPSAQVELATNARELNQGDGNVSLDVLDEPTARVYGSVNVEDFRVVNLPLFAKLLSLASLQGLVDLLDGGGIVFDHLELPFVMEGNSFQVSKALASGASLGVTMEGVYERDIQQIDVAGTLVPAYGLNAAFGRVPLLGDIFVSRKGEGIFALTYGIEGPLAEAKVFVNPLSVLAPGFLRRLFQFGDPKVKRQELPETARFDSLEIETPDKDATKDHEAIAEQHVEPVPDDANAAPQNE